MKNYVAANMASKFEWDEVKHKIQCTEIQEVFFKHLNPRRVQCKYSQNQFLWLASSFFFLFSDYLLVIYADDWRFANRNQRRRKNMAFTTQTESLRENMCEIIRHISCWHIDLVAWTLVILTVALHSNFFSFWLVLCQFCLSNLKLRIFFFGKLSALHTGHSVITISNSKCYAW